MISGEVPPSSLFSPLRPRSAGDPRFFAEVACEGNLVDSFLLLMDPLFEGATFAISCTRGTEWACAVGAPASKVPHVSLLRSPLRTQSSKPHPLDWRGGFSM